MSNKVNLQTNNEALDALITRVNAAKDTAASLPSAGGGSIATYTGIVYGLPALGDSYVYFYTDENLSLRAKYVPNRTSDTIQVLTNTIIVCYMTDMADSSEQELIDYYLLNYNTPAFIYLPTSDGFEICV